MSGKASWTIDCSIFLGSHHIAAWSGPAWAPRRGSGAGTGTTGTGRDGAFSNLVVHDQDDDFHSLSVVADFAFFFGFPKVAEKGPSREEKGPKSCNGAFGRPRR